jgi:hypothetical protein
LPFYLPISIFQHLSYISLYPLPSQLLCFTILLSIILLSFLSFPKFHRVVPLSQEWSTYEFVYDQVCFCVYVYLLDLPFMYEGKHEPLSFWACFTSLNNSCLIVEVIFGKQELRFLSAWNDKWIDQWKKIKNYIYYFNVKHLWM